MTHDPAALPERRDAEIKEAARGPPRLLLDTLASWLTAELKPGKLRAP